VVLVESVGSTCKLNLNILHEREHSLVKSAFELLLKQHIAQGTQGFV